MGSPHWNINECRCRLWKYTEEKKGNTAVGQFSIEYSTFQNLRYVSLYKNCGSGVEGSSSDQMDLDLCLYSAFRVLMTIQSSL